MSNLFVLRDFKSYPAGRTATFALGTTVEMKKVTLFATPAIAYTVMEAGVEKLNDAAAKQAQGGTQATAYKDQCLEELWDLLDKQADYVQTQSEGVLSVLLSSGFKAASTNVGQSPLETPVVMMLNNPMSEQLGVRVGPVRNAKSYEVRYHNGDGVWQFGGVFPSTRKVVLDDLTSGKCYTIQVRAIGGSTGSSGWSDPQSRYVL